MHEHAHEHEAQHENAHAPGESGASGISRRGHAHGNRGGHEGHKHGRDASVKRLTVVLALSGTYMVAEVVGGLLTNSLALLADAGHMLSDVAALALALFAMRMARRPATPRRTYGYHRTEILAALVNGATLVAASLYIFVEAWERFRAPPEVAGGTMMAVAAGGLGINLVGLWILNAGSGETLNERGAWLHVLGDALGSVGAIAGGLLVWWKGWYWADPAVSVLIGILVVVSSWALLKETVAVLMEGAPGHIDVDEVRTAIREVPGVAGVHDLHVWSITSGMVSLSVHVTAAGDADAAIVPGLRRDLLRVITRTLRERFGIDHTTIQLEPEGFEEDPVHD